MIVFDQVTKYYPTPNGRQYVLRDVSLELPADRNIGVFGRNGSGKSTLLRLLGGVDYPNKGKITFPGNVSWPLGLSGYQGSMTGRENAEFICRVYGQSAKVVKERIGFIREFSELEDYFDMPLKTYSSGMRSKFSFAVSMAFDFDHYLIDELTAVGDKRFREKCNEVFNAKKGRAHFIFVSHNLPELKKQCDMGLFVRDGAIHLYDSVDEAIEVYNAA